MPYDGRILDEVLLLDARGAARITFASSQHCVREARRAGLHHEAVGCPRARRKWTIRWERDRVDCPG